MLNIGDKAPDFKGKTYDGKELTLSTFKGKKLVLFFYPKDNTPGCTAEACNLRDNYALFQSKGYEIVGVSTDSEKSHQKFTEKHQLPFPLIADTEKEMVKAYEVWGLKKFMGREYIGIKRTTFVIDENGMIEDIITKVKTKEHTIQTIDI